MIKPFLMGLIGGQRAMTPLAAVSLAATTGRLAARAVAPSLLSHPIVTVGTVALAVAEMAGDKKRNAPDRTVPAGLTARFLSSAVAGAALAPRHQRLLGAAVGGVTAVVASYPGWRARMKSMEHSDQVTTGLVEDAAVVASAAAIVTRP